MHHDLFCARQNSLNYFKKFFIFLLVYIYGPWIYAAPRFTNRVHIHFFGADGTQALPNGQVNTLPFPNNYTFGIVTSVPGDPAANGLDQSDFDACHASTGDTSNKLFSIFQYQWSAPCSALIYLASTTPPAEDHIVVDFTLSDNEGNAIGSIDVNELWSALNVFPNTEVFPGLQTVTPPPYGCNTTGYTISGCSMNSIMDGAYTVQTDVYCSVSRCVPITGSVK